MDAAILSYVGLAVFATPIFVGSCAMLVLQCFVPTHLKGADGTSTTYDPMALLVERGKTLPASTESVRHAA